MTKHVRLLLPIFICLCPSFSTSQTQNYEVSVNTITVWVRVLDKHGQPVQGLRAEDFSVFENGQSVALSCFEEIGTEADVDVSMGTTSSETNEQSGRRRLMIYLDLFSINGAEYDDLKPMVEKFLTAVPKDRWDVTVAAFAPDGKLRILVKPTGDFQKVYSLLSRLPTQSQRDLDMIKKSNEIEKILKLLAYGIEDREMILKKACQTAKHFATEERQISQYSLKALETLMAALSKEEPAEQKIIAHFSAGFNSDPGRIYYELIEKMSGSDTTELYMDIPECKKDLSFHPSRNVQNAMGGMNRSNVTLYSINTRAFYPGSVLQLQNTTVNLNEASILADYRFFQQKMAEESGGLFFPNLAKFNQGMNSIVNDLEHQYVLCYRQPEQKDKTDYRKITVQCKKPGVGVRHRKGYIP